MKRYYPLIILLLAALLLCGCGAKEKYEPFTELSKQTVSPAREAEIQAALNGTYPTATSVPTIAPPTEVPIAAPAFDENSFFAEVDSGSGIVTDEVPFEPEPTATSTPLPTPTPEPTATKPYDPNIMMYNTTNGFTTYTLQEGDSLVCLGRRFDVSVSHLLAQNGLTDPNEVGVGDIVVLPRNPNAWSLIDGYGRRMLVMHPTTYTTRAGDTLFSIACAFGDVRPEDIAIQNQLVLGEPLQSGLVIVIP